LLERLVGLAAKQMYHVWPLFLWRSPTNDCSAAPDLAQEKKGIAGNASPEEKEEITMYSSRLGLINMGHHHFAKVTEAVSNEVHSRLGCPARATGPIACLGSKQA
jgi:hypothetical protein